MTYEYDAILVLACGIQPNGVLTDDAKRSVEIAVSLYEADKAPCIIFSGYLSYKARFTPVASESEAMYSYAQTLGISGEVLIGENTSQDTLGNAYFTKVKHLVPRKAHKLIIVPGPNHLAERVRYVFAKVLGPDYAIEVFERDDYRESEKQRELESLHKLKALLKGVVDGDHESIYEIMQTKHPAYCSSSQHS